MERAISVCIPCYRDLAGLRATIPSVLEVLAEVPTIICEFVIGLNHCDFGEGDVMEPFRDFGSHVFSVIRSDGYLEYDDSLKFTISHASQDACLMMGCGDIAKPGFGSAIEKFLNDNLKMGILAVEHGAIISSVKTRDDVWQPTQSGFFNKVLSGHLFDREVLREAMKDPLIGFEWAHVELAIRGAAIAGGETLITSRPVIWRGEHGAGWWTRADIIKQYIEYSALMDGYHERYPNLAFPAAEARKAGGIRLLLTVLQARCNGFRELPMFLILWQDEHKVSKLLKMLIRTSFILPQPLVRAFHNLLMLGIRLRS